MDIEEIFQDLQTHFPNEYKWGLEIPPTCGWAKLVSELHIRLKAISPDYILKQVKEKFNGLRYYADYVGNSDVHKDIFHCLISQAENASYYIDYVTGEYQFKVGPQINSFLATTELYLTNLGNKGVNISFGTSQGSTHLKFKSLNDVNLFYKKLKELIDDH